MKFSHFNGKKVWQTYYPPHFLLFT